MRSPITQLALFLALIAPQASMADVSAFDQAGLDAGLTISAEINDSFDLMESAETAEQFDSAFHKFGSVFMRPNLSKVQKAFLCSAILSRTTTELVQIETQLSHKSAEENLERCLSEINIRLQQEHLRVNIADTVSSIYVPRLNFRTQVFPDMPGVYINQNLKPKEVVLTFDDGPSTRFTPVILDILDRAGVKAIFFNIGENAQDHAALSKLVIARGHGLGSHSFFHTLSMGCKLQKGLVSQNFVLSEMIKGHAAVLNASSEIDPFTRFPNGSKTKVLSKNINEMALNEFFWAVDTEDWRHKKDVNGVPRAQAILMKFISDMKETRSNANSDRGIILMHDIWPQTVEALPLILNWLKQNNYTVVLPTSGLRSNIALNKNVPNYYEAVARSIHADRKRAVNVFSFNSRLTIETRARPVSALASSPEAEWVDPSEICTTSPRGGDPNLTPPPVPFSDPVFGSEPNLNPPFVIPPQPSELDQLDPPRPPLKKKKKKKGILRIFGI